MRLARHRPRARKQYLLLGDSHAAHLYPGLLTVYPEINLLQASGAGCKPFLGMAERDTGICGQLSGFLYRQWLPSHHIDAVLLATRWVVADLPELRSTITWFQQRGIAVFVLGPSIEYDVLCPASSPSRCAITI